MPGELAEAVRAAVESGLVALDRAEGEDPDGTAAGGAAGEPVSGEEPRSLPHGIAADEPVPRPLPDPSSVPDTLAWIAVRELDRVADAPQDREAAIRLLAADASLTWAFEAAAGRDEELEVLAERSGLHGRIGRLLGRAGRGPEDDAGSSEGDGRDAPGTESP